MALTDVVSADGYLLAQSSTAQAISEPLTQQLIDTDYRKVKEARVWYYLDDISGATGSADTLITAVPVDQGDTLLIRKYDGTIEQLDVTTTPAVSQSAQVVPAMFSDTLPAGICATSGGGGSQEAYRAFDKHPDTWAYLGQTNSWVSYQFKDSTPTKIYGYYIKTRPNYNYLYNCKLQYSDNSLDWFDVPGGATTGDLRTDYANGYYLELLDPADGVTPLPATHPFFRVWVTQAQSSIYFEHLELIGDGVEIDTSSVTQGEVPTLAYKFNPELYFNEALATEDVARRATEYGLWGNRLRVVSIYPETTFLPKRELVTTFNFKAVGTVMTEITSQIYALKLVQGNDTHTSNTTPTGIGQVSMSGTSGGIVQADAYKVYDGDNTTTAYSITTDASGVVDFEHTYQFDNPTIIYGIKMTTGNYKTAPSKYTVSGSNDGTTWTELLNIQQSIAANDLTLTKYFNPDDYAPYTYYKIAVTESNNVDSLQLCEANEYVLLKEDPNS